MSPDAKKERFKAILSRTHKFHDKCLMSWFEQQLKDFILRHGGVRNLAGANGVLQYYVAQMPDIELITTLIRGEIDGQTIFKCPTCRADVHLTIER